MRSSLLPKPDATDKKREEKDSEKHPIACTIHSVILPEGESR